jgi:hypothetical protein
MNNTGAGSGPNQIPGSDGDMTKQSAADRCGSESRESGNVEKGLSAFILWSSFEGSKRVHWLKVIILILVIAAFIVGILLSGKT